MENFILIDDFDSWIALKEAPSQKVPNKIMCMIGKYKNVHDL